MYALWCNRKTSQQSRLRILHLSHRHSCARLVKTALDNIGYSEVVASVSPRQAISSFIRNRYDLLITNLNLAGISGVELIRRIRAGQTIVPPDLAILVLAGEDELNADQCPFDPFDMGINAVLMIPFTLDELDKQITYALRCYYLADEATDAIRESGSALSQRQGLALPRSESFSLPFAELKEGMYLLESITVHGQVLIPAGTCLRESHLTVIGQMEPVLEGETVLLSFVLPAIDCNNPWQ